MVVVCGLLVPLGSVWRGAGVRTVYAVHYASPSLA